MSADRSSTSLYASPDENSLFLDIQQEAPLFSHRKPTRIFGSIFYCLLLAGYVILAVAAIWILPSLQELIPLILCSCDVILLVVTGMFQQYLVYQVQKIRLQGYYGFSQKLKHLIRLPFASISYGTAAMLLIMAWKSHITILSISLLLRILYLIYFKPQSPESFFASLVFGTASFFGVCILSAIIMVVEAICAGFFMSAYIAYVHQYNSLDSEPDVLNSLYSPLQQSSSLEGLRYHDGGRLSDQQMALLQYQRENLHFLSEEILRLQECLSKYERSDDGSTPQVDLAHLLAARDQELRTLSAEMNHLQSELRLARSLIAERDVEIQHFRSTNNQYVEENERIRAILGEWSTRAAKLERALEVERMSNLELQKKITTSKSGATQEQVEPTLQMEQ